MKELKLTKQQFQEIVDAYEMYIEGTESYLNIETGVVVTLPNYYEQDEEEKELSEIIDEGFNEIYFQMPKPTSDEGYKVMSDFAETVADRKLRSALEHILSGGKKIFRRFKDELGSEQSDRYYLFVEERNRMRISDWLDSIQVKVES